MRVNGVLAIMQHLGYQCRKGVSYRMWRRLKAKKLPHYRDPDDNRRVFAFSEELDAWDKKRTNRKASLAFDQQIARLLVPPGGESGKERTLK